MFKVGDSALFKYVGNGGFWSVLILSFSLTGNYAEVMIDGLIVPPDSLRKFDPITEGLSRDKRFYSIAIAELLPFSRETSDPAVPNTGLCRS